MLRPIVLLGVLALTGCGVVGMPSVDVSSRGAPATATDAGGRRMVPDSVRSPQPGGLAPFGGVRTPAAVPAERRVCRTGAWPPGWIAVAYVDAAGECPPDPQGGVARAAILAEHRSRPVGTVLEVCADQPTPRGWEPGRVVADEWGRCPGAGRDGASATKQLRRVR
jgi:hypothetical protein